MKNLVAKFNLFVFIIISLLLIVIGISFPVRYIHEHNETLKFLESAESTNATISEIRSYYDSRDKTTRHNVFIKYEIDNNVYSNELHFYAPEMQEGETLTIYYNPNNPEDFEYLISDSIDPLSLVLLCIFGGVFCIFGIIIITLSIKSLHSPKSLKSTGTLLQAHIDNISLNRDFAVNDIHPYKITASCQDPLSGKMLVFTQENIWFNVKELVESKSIETVDVYVDPLDSTKYFIDVENLKNVL